MKNPLTEKFDRVEGYWFIYLIAVGAAVCEIYHSLGITEGLVTTAVLIVVGFLMAYKAGKRSK